MTDLDHSSRPARFLPHSSHWGAFSVRARDREIEIVPHPRDAAPSALLGNIPASVAHKARIARPMVRRGWLERGPGSDRRRGSDEFVALAWPDALDRVAAELRRVYAAQGPRAVFGGSYGWASAGRFHDAQHQLHRFLNLAGGYVRSVNSYSSGAAAVILPHVIGPQAAVAGNNVRQHCCSFFSRARPDILAAFDQQARDVPADESRSSGNENRFHGRAREATTVRPRSTS